MVFSMGHKYWHSHYPNNQYATVNVFMIVLWLLGNGLYMYIVGNVAIGFRVVGARDGNSLQIYDSMWHTCMTHADCNLK